MKKLKEIEVWFSNKMKVGTLKSNDERPYTTIFRYSDEWLKNGFSISPFSLPLEQREFVANPFLFEGVFGVFADSLPDGWGRLLVDRMLKNSGLSPSEVKSLNRLAIVGDSGMGALTYVPVHHFDMKENDLDLDRLALACKEVLIKDSGEDLDELFKFGGSSGGARPKILTQVEGEEWIIKFPSSVDKLNIGKQEYEYSICAKKCGIEMPDTRLFSSNISTGYFGVKRFDRENGKRKHMLSVSALLETSHRIPNLDYNDLMQITKRLTSSEDEIKKMFKLMCFNIFSHNRDDHSKNFSFVYDEKSKSWKLSPAYDLTYSYSIGGEHATTVNGNGKNPSLKEILEVAKKIALDVDYAERTALEIEKIVTKDLKKYL